MFTDCVHLGKEEHTVSLLTCREVWKAESLRHGWEEKKSLSIDGDSSIDGSTD